MFAFLVPLSLLFAYFVSNPISPTPLSKQQKGPRRSIEMNATLLCSLSLLPMHYTPTHPVLYTPPSTTSFRKPSTTPPPQRKPSIHQGPMLCPISAGLLRILVTRSRPCCARRLAD